MEKLNLAVQQRLRLIDFLLEYYGSVSRKETMDYFGLKSATATRDFALYKEMAPGNALFNDSTKRYVKSDSFKRVFP